MRKETRHKPSPLYQTDTPPEMVENYFKFVTVSRKKIKEQQLSPRVKKLRGIIKTDENVDYKKILTEELSKKYGV